MVHGSLMRRSREFVLFWFFLGMSDKIEREREGVESGVSAHHHRAEIRFSLITGFPLILFFTAKITSHIISDGIIHQKCSTLISVSKICFGPK